MTEKPDMNIKMNEKPRHRSQKFFHSFSSTSIDTRRKTVSTSMNGIPVNEKAHVVFLSLKWSKA